MRFQVEVQGPLEYVSEGRYRAMPNTNYRLRLYNHTEYRVNAQLVIDDISVSRSSLNPHSFDTTRTMQVKEYGDVSTLEITFSPCVSGMDQVWGGIRPGKGMNHNALVAGLGGYNTWTQHQAQRTQHKMSGYLHPEWNDLFQNEDLSGFANQPYVAPEKMVFYIMNPLGTADTKPSYVAPPQLLDPVLQNIHTNVKSQDRNATWYSIDPGSRNHPFESPFA